MSKTKYTKMQQTAIDLRGKNILVSAAAGSGKTAVLVQRIIDRILDENHPIDIDRILVMTFTRAAAAQMKEKILNAINEKRNSKPHDKNLNKQYALVHNAYIMTIDSFCMNVVKNHFEEIGLSPDFRMADEGEIKLIKQDVLEEVIEDCYEESDDGFLEMTEIFASKKTDLAIEKLVLSLSENAESYPDPVKWLDSCVPYASINSSQLEQGENDGNISQNACEDTSSLQAKYPWIEIYVNYVKDELTYLRNILDEAGDICAEEYGPAVYLAAIEQDIEKIDWVLGFNSYEELYEKCLRNEASGFAKLATLRMPKEDEVSETELLERTRLRDRVKTIREKYKKSYSDIVELVSIMSPDSIELGMSMMAEPIAKLISVAKLFVDRFEEKKREMNVVDFSDIEHMCLQILRTGIDTTAKQYREFFEEIYVDEYQDSNFVQEEILNLIARRTQKDENTPGNVFMVGDVKQSIYGFRNAKPEIFIDKYDRYSKDFSELDVRVDLSHNFRSRAEVLDSVNSLFKKIMTRNLGGIEYDENAALHLGREFPVSGCDYKTELNLFVSDPEVSDKEAEALMVANRIKRIMHEMKVEDASSEGGIRPVRYSDIVILLRTAKGWDNIFMDVLESQGIPVFVTSSTGYFETIEVRTLLNFLKIIDNPLQDIPFAAVMMSMIGDFNEEEVALIRAEFKEGYLFDAFEAYYKLHCHTDCDETVLSYKVRKLYTLLYYYRRKSEYTAVSDILTEIIDGEYGKLTKAMPGGQKRFANINMLLKKAIEYGKTSYKGIFQFNRYIEAIRKYEVDYGEANISDESDNAVRIMSIHKSKGLEFPVCFVSGMNKKFNMMDTKATVLTDGEFGIATDVIDIKKRVKSKSMQKIAISRKKNSEIIAEELRLLYVAMTRAKEKLILTGAVKDEDSFRNALVTLENSKSYLDMYSVASKQGELDNVQLSFITAEDLVDELVADTVNEEVSRADLLSLIRGERTEEYEEELVKRLDFEYPFVDKGYVKLSVTQLKKMSDREFEPEDKSYIDNTVYLYDEDKFIEDVEAAKEIADSRTDGKKRKTGDNSGANHGSAVHRIFEIWDYDKEPTMESVEEFLAHVKEEKLMTDELSELVEKAEVLDFVSSGIGLRMREAFKRGQLFREQPFVMCDDENDPESMLIQGVIDAFFIEDDEIVLVDYKTDKVKKAETLKEKYSVQLVHYGRALRRLLHKEIKESVIYSTVLKECISI